MTFQGSRINLGGVSTWQRMGLCPFPGPEKCWLSKLSHRMGRAGRHPLAAGMVHTLLEERLMKGPCPYSGRAGVSHSIGRSLGKLFLPKFSQVSLAVGPSAWPSCPSSEPLRLSLWISASDAVLPPRLSIVHFLSYFLCPLLPPAPFRLPRANPPRFILHTA